MITGLRLGNFLKNRVQVRRDVAIKKLLKIYLFIDFIYCVLFYITIIKNSYNNNNKINSSHKFLTLE